MTAPKVRLNELLHQLSASDSLNKHEIERKFLLSTLPSLENAEEYEIEQHYLIIDDGREARIRHENNDFFITEKLGSGIDRIEREMRITGSDFESLLELSKVSIKKRRYKIGVQGIAAYIDVYSGKLNGLNTVEIEFPSTAESGKFPVQPWFGVEVTNASRYKNVSLATNGIPKKLRLELSDKESGLKEAKESIERILSSKDKPTIVMVAGGSASGKTTAIARGIKNMFPDSSAILSMDDYYRGTKYISEHSLNFDEPRALDLELLKVQIKELSEGRKIMAPNYSFKIGERTGYSEFSPNKLIIVEGLFALSPELEGVGDLKIFVDTGSHGRLLRKMFRDVERASWSPAYTLEYSLSTVEPMYDKYIKPTAENADILISNEYKPEIETRSLRSWEKQIKLRMMDDKDVQKNIILLGAEHIATLRQNDDYYVPKDKGFTSEDEILRVRHESDSCYLTYKGPKKDGSSERPKFEFEINGRIEKELISRLYSVYSQISKTREVYSLNGMIFTLDDVYRIDGPERKHIGKFIEIRLPKDGEESQTDKLLDALHLQSAEKINGSYYKI